jgi:hypothetical protein
MPCTRSVTFFYCALAMLVAFSGQAFADYTRVAVTPPNVPSCEGQYYAVFNTISSAIAATPAGGTVFVCPGIYAEQVVINKKLILQGASYGTQGAAVIVPPAGGMVGNAFDLVSGNPIAAQILVTPLSGTITVTINNLTVDGTGNGISGCSPDLQGILYQNASGTVNHVAVRNQIPGGIAGSCLTGGEAVFVQSSTGLSTVTVETSSMHYYNTNGITGNGPGTKLTVTGNYVQGSGVISGGAVQNGIQLGFGAKGKITLNTVSDNISASTTQASADILLFDAAEGNGTATGPVVITNNTLGYSQLAIALETDGLDGGNLGDGVYLSGNKIYGATSDAIDVCTNANVLTSNTIFNSGRSAVHFDASCGALFGGSTGTNNSATKNTILESGCAGILDDTSGAGGNITTPDTFYTLPFSVTDSAGSCPILYGWVARGNANARDTRKVSPKK